MKTIERLDVDEIIAGIDLENIFSNTFLITGATGSIARYIVLVLMEVSKRYPDKACNVVVMCRNKEKAARIFEDYIGSEHFKLICCSVEETIKIDYKIDYIVHAACVSATSYFHDHPVQIASSNVIGTYNLLSLAREQNVKGFLFFSSGAVYGGMTKDDYSYNGINPLEGKNCYAMSKKMGENFCADFFEEYGVPAKIVRIGYTYGPHIDLNDGHLYSDFIRAIIQSEDLLIKGDGQNGIGLCYVTDAVQAFFLILFNGKEKTPYVMRNNREYTTIQELARKLVQEAFPERKLDYKCMVKSEERNELPKSRAPEFLNALGWYPKVDVVDGFRRVVNYLEEKY